MNKEITLKSYTLRTDSGQWLGQIVLTSDGFFSGVTDYGNLSYAWRSFGDVDFEDFILSLSVDYFAGKLQNGLSYIAYSKTTQKACNYFAEMILPALKKAIREERLTPKN